MPVVDVAPLQGPFALSPEFALVAGSFAVPVPVPMPVVPGDVVVLDKDTLSTTANPTYYLVEGTSFAAPQISGAAALVWQAYPYFSNYQVQQTLLGIGERRAVRRQQDLPGAMAEVCRGRDAGQRARGLRRGGGQASRVRAGALGDDFGRFAGRLLVH